MSVTLRGRAQTAPQTTRASAWARALARWSYLPLACILTLQAGVAVLTLRNTAFQDEALYLYAGRQLMTSIRTGVPEIDPFASYMSGNPYFYPLLAGIFDAWGGVEAARVLSLVAMLVVTICVYWVAGHLFSRESAIFAAAIFAFQGPVLFLARLATYDAMCLMLLALAVVVAFRASTARAPLLALALGPLLVLATLNKYAAMLWAPSTLAILAWQTLGARGWFQALLRVVLALISIAASAALALAVLDHSFLHAVAGSTTSRAITQPAPRPGLIWEVVALGGIGLTLGFLGLLFAGRKRRMIALILFGSALLAPAYHLYKAEPVSLDKHIAYAMFFAAPLAGYAVTRLAGAGRTLVVASRSWLAALALCLIVFLLGAQQGHWMFHTWSDSSGMVQVMRSLVRPTGGHYLAEDMEVARYYLRDVTEDWQWVGPFWFEYTSKQGQYFAGVDAYKAAVADGFFDVIEMSYGVAAPLDFALQPELLSGKQYDLAAKVFVQNVYGAAYTMIWRKHVVAGAAPSGDQGGGPPPAPAGPNGFVPFTPSVGAFGERPSSGLQALYPQADVPYGSPLAMASAWKNAAPWSVG